MHLGNCSFTGVWLIKSPLIFLFVLAQSLLAVPELLHLSPLFHRQDGWCSEASLLKRPVVICALVCLYSEQNTASCHLPIICKRFKYSHISLYTVYLPSWGSSEDRTEVEVEISVSAPRRNVC